MGRIWEAHRWLEGASKCVPAQLLSPSVCLIPALNISQAQSPLIAENWIGQAECRSARDTHNMGSRLSFCTSMQSQKTHSCCVTDWCQATTEAEHPRSCVSVHFVKNNTQTRAEHSKWDPDQNCVCKTGTEMSVTCGKAAYANDV